MDSEQHVGCKDLFLKWLQVKNEEEHIGSAGKDVGQIGQDVRIINPHPESVSLMLCASFSEAVYGLGLPSPLRK